LHIFMNIQSIKSCMAKGRTVVLIHSENLYESLYDLLNQHYTEYQVRLRPMDITNEISRDSVTYVWR
jgi:hypothetical protein